MLPTPYAHSRGTLAYMIMIVNSYWRSGAHVRVLHRGDLDQVPLIG